MLTTPKAVAVTLVGFVLGRSIPWDEPAPALDRPRLTYAGVPLSVSHWSARIGKSREGRLAPGRIEIEVSSIVEPVQGGADRCEMEK